MYLSILNPWGVDWSGFSTLRKCKMHIGTRNPAAIHDKPPSFCSTRKQVHLKVLCTAFPTDTIAALLTGFVHIMVSKHILEAADLDTSPQSMLSSFCYPPLVASLSS